MRSPTCGYRLLGQTNSQAANGRHLQGRLCHCDEAAFVYLYKFSCPVELLNPAFQLTQFLRKGVDLLLERGHGHGGQNPDFGVSGAHHRGAGAVQEIAQDPDLEPQTVAMGEQLGKSLSVGRSLRIGQVDADDKLVELHRCLVEMSQELLGIFGRLFALLDFRIGCQSRAKLLDALLCGRSIGQGLGKFHRLQTSCWLAISGALYPADDSLRLCACVTLPCFLDECVRFVPAFWARGMGVFCCCPRLKRAPYPSGGCSCARLLTCMMIAAHGGCESAAPTCSLGETTGEVRPCLERLM